MFVCICFPVTEDEIRTAVRDARIGELLAGTDCGSCVETISVIVEDEARKMLRLTK